jgi:hypothetical protein
VATITRTVEIAASREAAFDFVVSAWEGALGFWAGGIERWTPQPGRSLGPGYRVSYTARMLGIPTRVEMEVVEFSRPEGWTAQSCAGPPVTGEWRFAAAGAGTSFTYRLSYRMPPPIVGPLLDRLVIAGRWQRVIEQSLDNLKRRLEAGGSDRP